MEIGDTEAEGATNKQRRTKTVQEQGKPSSEPNTGGAHERKERSVRVRSIHG